MQRPGAGRFILLFFHRVVLVESVLLSFLPFRDFSSLRKHWFSYKRLKEVAAKVPEFPRAHCGVAANDKQTAGLSLQTLSPATKPSGSRGVTAVLEMRPSAGVQPVVS